MEIYDSLFARYPQLEGCRAEIGQVHELLVGCFASGGKVLTCGNGGSAADSEHFVGELTKSFRKRRALDPSVASKLRPELAAKLEGALPAVALPAMTGAVSAFANDVSWETAFAQQVLALGRSGDVLIVFSTSGNSANCVAAAEVAKAKGLRTVALTGERESKLSAVCDVTVRVGATETYQVQELHLPVYHALCAAVEDRLF